MNVITLSGYWQPGKRKTLPLHRNTGLEIVCVTGGRSDWRVEGQIYRVQPGSVFFTWPWEEHGGVSDIQPGLELCFIIINLDQIYINQPRTFDWHANLSLPQREGRQILRILQSCPTRVLPLSQELLQLVRKIAQEHTAQHLLSGTLLRALTISALVELARIIERPIALQDRTQDTEHKVRELIAYLQDHSDEPWSVETMARICNLSRSRLTDLVRQQTGDPPLMLLNRLRIEKAKQLLIQTRRKVVDIAMSCGFSTQQYFCRVFREYSGTTPAAYRRQHQT